MTKTNNSALPVAIVLAGAMIAGALYIANSGKSNTQGGIKLPEPKAAETKQVPAIRDTDYVRGSRDAKLVIVEYTDPECPFCNRFHGTMKKVVDAFDAKDVAWVYRHFPLTSLHSKAVNESIAIECAGRVGGEDKFWQYVDTLYANTPGNNRLDPAKLDEFAATVGLNTAEFTKCRNNPEVEKFVQNSITEATETGGRGTPYPIILYKGQQIPLPGAVPFDDYQTPDGKTNPGMKTIIESILAQ